MHLSGTDLDFRWSRVVGVDGGVQRLVAVGLGDRYIVLEAAWHRKPERVDEAHDVIAFRHCLDQDAQREEIVDAVEVHVDLGARGAFCRCYRGA